MVKITLIIKGMILLYRQSWINPFLNDCILFCHNFIDAGGKHFSAEVVQGFAGVFFGEQSFVKRCFVHGGADPVVDTDYSRNMVGALEDAGATVRYTEYPGVGHDCWTRAYGTEEMWTWMFEQRKA